MRSIHKLTHRPLLRRVLTLGLFALLGAAGWQLPRVGRAALAYSNQALTAARSSVVNSPSETKAAAAPVVNAAAGMQLTPGQQALSQASADLDAALASARSNPQGKASERAVQTARDKYNAAVVLRLSEIKARINALSAKKETGKTSGDSGTAEGISAEYNTLTAELKSLGGFPNVVEAPAPNQVNETEPNNTPATANTLNVASGALAIGSGAITPAGDEDFWKFTAPANSKVWIYVDTGGTATGDERDTQVDLFNTNGTTLIENDDDDGTANGLDGTVESGFASAIAGRSLTAAGDYFIKVRDFDGTLTVNPYKLYVVVTTGATPVVAETEPNDTGATANVLLTAGQTTAIATGTVGTGATTDFYSITVNAGDILYANLDGDPERDGTGTDVALSLRDAAGTTVLVTSDSVNSGSAANPPAENFGFLFTTGGTFTLRVFYFGGQGTYNLMAKVVTPGGGAQVCPPVPITSNLGVAGGNFAKTSGTMTQRLNRDGVVSACGVARTQVAPIAGTFTFDKYTFTNSGAATACITISLTVVEQTASNYQVGAFSTFVPTNLTSGWLGDPGLSSGIPPAVQTFGVNIAAGASFDVVVFNTNATGDGNAYQLSVLGLPGCVAPPCGITCPANITVSNTANQCGATVTYAAPTTTGVCNTVTCTPASGSFFPKGTTTVTCSSAGNTNGTQTCSFTVTVNDTQPPTITCPANVSVGTTGTTAVVNYAAPVVTDNCPGVQATVCVPASGTAFALGTTTVTCTVKDAVNNTATCSFAVTVNKLTPPSLSDPLSCTGPGNVVNGSFAVTNNGAASQTVTATVALGPTTPFPSLLALPGTCVASVGTCTVVNGTTISYTGTLTGGQSATISYKLQVADGVLPGTVLTSTVTASFNGGAPVTASASLTATCQAPGPGPFYPASAEVTDQKAGSVLVYPVYTSSVGGSSQNSRISLTNTHQNLRAYVHLFFVSDSCAVSDAFICLTPNQTTTFLASDLDPGTTGYLVAVATDGVNGCPINFNYLIGDEYVKFTTGHAANLGAEAISAIAGSAFWASCNNNSTSATLAFDGVSYNRLPYVVSVDNIASRADGNDTIVVLDRIGGDLRTGPLGVGNVFGVFYNDAESSLSFTLSSSSCQYRFTVNNTVPRITPRFDQIITAGRTGWMKFYQRDGNALLGAVINYNANAGTATGAFNQGHNLHVLTLTDTASYIVPVFPPGC